MTNVNGFNGADNHNPTLSITRGGLMYLSDDAMFELDHFEDMEYFLFFNFDTKEIGISRTVDSEYVDPFLFLANGVADVETFVEDCNLTPPCTYTYKGRYGDLMVFKPCE